MKKMLVLLAVVPFVNFAQTTFVEKEITGKVASARPDSDVFKNCLLPINFI